MSSVTVQWFGLNELREQLRRLPDDLAAEAGHIVQGAANAAAAAVRTEYGAHRVTGNLQEHVVVVPGSHDRYGAGYLVKSTAKHAHIFESGTVARHYISVGGVQHETGAMPAFNIFIPAMIRARHQMFVDLVAMLRRVTGWQVTDAAA